MTIDKKSWLINRTQVKRCLKERWQEGPIKNKRISDKALRALDITLERMITLAAVKATECKRSTILAEDVSEIE